MSADANDSRRRAVAAASDRAALLRWLDSLDEEFGAPSPAELETADRLLDAIERRTNEAEHRDG